MHAELPNGELRFYGGRGFYRCHFKFGVSYVFLFFSTLSPEEQIGFEHLEAVARDVERHGPGALMISSTGPFHQDGDTTADRQNVARFRLYRHRSFQLKSRFSAFFKNYQMI